LRAPSGSGSSLTVSGERGGCKYGAREADEETPVGQVVVGLMRPGTDARVAWRGAFEFAALRRTHAKSTKAKLIWAFPNDLSPFELAFEILSLLVA
jgi:hypothetical protein